MGLHPGVAEVPLELRRGTEGGYKPAGGPVHMDGQVPPLLLLDLIQGLADGLYRLIGAG